MDNKDNFHKRFESLSDGTAAQKTLTFLFKGLLWLLLIVGGISLTVGLVIAVWVFAFKAAPFVLGIAVIGFVLYSLAKLAPDEGKEKS